MVVSGKFGWKVKGAWLLGRCSTGKLSVHIATEHPGCLLFTKANRFSPRFWQMISKIQDWWILPWNHVYHLYKSVSFTKKRPQRRETGIKDRWEEMEYGFLFGRFYPEKQDYLFRCSVAPGNFLLERPKKSCYLYFPTRFSGNVKW